MTYVSRDPFARQETHRRTLTPRPGQTCDWCGQLTAKGKLFEYEVQTDGGRTHAIRGTFCSISCMKDYTR